MLKPIEEDINGVNVPWLYLGQLFATFCWHNEDNYLFSINYAHLGAPKQWYGIPGADAGAYERVLRDVVPERLREEPDLIYHITTMISPSLLKNNDVPVFQLVQRPGEFVVTFPQAYHGGFSHGVRVPCQERVTNHATRTRHRPPFPACTSLLVVLTGVSFHHAVFLIRAVQLR